ncbi:MAG: DUF2357 domain-containing protein [Oscillospiraceae bacterium]
MSDAYKQWYTEFQDAVEQFDDDALFASLSSLLHQSQNTFAINRKLMQKAIDVSWVEAIENGLIHVDNCLRNPRRTIEDVEEIVPIALSRKITVESVKHLAQHTDLIQSYDKKTGKITPSKILNVHKEESLMTYENKFVNTLIDRLYLFINTRYEKLAQVSKDEQAYTLGYDTSIEDGSGGQFKLELKIESISSLDSYDESGYTVWQRVEKLKTVIEGYKGSELCTTLGNAYIRPPVMRTNAIMKNVDLKACLTLWQYIESYDKAGYEINIEDTALQPEGVYVEDFYRLVLMNMLLFRSQMQQAEDDDKLTELKTSKRKKPIQPKFLRKFDDFISDDYNISTTGAAGYIASESTAKIAKKLPAKPELISEQIAQAINIEKAYQDVLEQKRIEKRVQEEYEAMRKAQQERIEAARKAELERLRQEREERQKQLDEMLAQKRAEQEAAIREFERQEAERLARLEEQRKREEEERIRREQEQLQREQEAREEEERQRVAQNTMFVRSELGDAAGMDVENLPETPEQKLEDVQVTQEEIDEAISEMDEETAEFEDPREVAARHKLEQQRREKERAERERAERLKVKRQHFENKPFQEIYREYSYNPIYLIPRLIMYLLVVLFNLIPEDTDNPDWIKKLEAIKEQKRIAEIEKEKQFEMESYYRKYARTFRYQILRDIEDIRFRRKKRKRLKGKPLPLYEEPYRTEEQKKELQREMQRLYREYHVSWFEKIRRWWKEVKRMYSSKTL